MTIPFGFRVTTTTQTNIEIVPQRAAILNHPKESMMRTSTAAPGATLQWAINGPEDIIRAVPGIRLLAAVSAFQTYTGDQRTPAVYRVMSTAMALIPALRMMAQYQRYEF